MLGPLWDNLSAFIQERDPAFLTTVRGVPRGDVTACEEGCGIVLPSIYVDFLTLMGADSGSFHPFGATYTARFYEVLATLRPGKYPVDRYFKVAFDHDDSAITRYNTFIDLGRAGGGDAPLVFYEEVGDFSEDDVEDTGFTLAEEFTQNVFESFDVARRAKKDAIRVYCPTDLDAHKARLFDLLAKMGLSPVWPPLPRVACFRSETLSALVTVSTEADGLNVTLGAANAKLFGIAVEQIKDTFPLAMADEDD